jgi:Uma2 family endonuclease
MLVGDEWRGKVHGFSNMTTATPLVPTTQRLLTAEEFADLPDSGVPRELLQGMVVEMNVPAPRHGEICWNVARQIGGYAEDQGVGRIVINRSGIITARDPDTVRGGDVAYYSFSRIPRGPLPRGYLNVLPELVFEVRSPTDRWSQVLPKAMDYLETGVLVVCVVDDVGERLLVYRNEDPPIPQTLRGDEELHLPEILGEFRVAVRCFFE